MFIGSYAHIFFSKIHPQSYETLSRITVYSISISKPSKVKAVFRINRNEFSYILLQYITNKCILCTQVHSCRHVSEYKPSNRLQRDIIVNLLFTSMYLFLALLCEHVVSLTALTLAAKGVCGGGGGLPLLNKTVCTSQNKY